MTMKKSLALTMLVVWPAAMFYDYRMGGAIHVMLAAAFVMWFLEANPMDDKPKARRTGPRHCG